MAVEVVTMSSKGQIALPVDIRKHMGLGSGMKLAVYSSGDVIMLKPIYIPTEEDFRARLDEAETWAASVGYTEEDVGDIIASVRKKKRV